jgi:hypothetical protein
MDVVLDAVCEGVPDLEGVLDGVLERVAVRDGV